MSKLLEAITGGLRGGGGRRLGQEDDLIQGRKRINPIRGKLAKRAIFRGSRQNWGGKRLLRAHVSDRGGGRAMGC